jgi:hypothetical protein
LEQAFINLLPLYCNPHVKRIVKVTRVFGWILKTDWDIDRVIELYTKKHAE